MVENINNNTETTWTDEQWNEYLSLSPEERKERDLAGARQLLQQKEIKNQAEAFAESDHSLRRGDPGYGKRQSDYTPEEQEAVQDLKAFRYAEQAFGLTRDQWDLLSDDTRHGMRMERMNAEARVDPDLYNWYTTDLSVNTEEIGDIGKSMWDQPEYTFDELLNYDDIRAKNQWGVAKLAAGVGKGAVIAGTTFLDGTLGLIWGVGTSLSEGRWSGLWDNDFMQLTQSWNDWAEQAMPNYYTQEELNRPWYMNIGTANFWGDAVIKNAGFTVGAMWGGATMNMAGRLIGRTAKGLQAMAKGVDDAASAVGNSKVLGNFGNLIVGGSISAETEGSIEAATYVKEWKEEQLRDLNEKYTEKMNAVMSKYPEFFDRNGYIRPEVEAVLNGTAGAGERVAPISDKMNSFIREVSDMRILYNSAKNKIDEEGAKLGNSILMQNMPILMLENMWVFKNVYVGKGATTSAQMRKFTTWENKNGRRVATVNRKALKSARNRSAVGKVAYESWQEGEQKDITERSGLYYGGRVHDFFNSALDPEAEKEAMSWLEATGKGFRKVWGDPNEYEDMAIGALMGAVGLPSPHTELIQDNDGNIRKKIKWSFSGGLSEAFKEYGERKKRAEEAVSYVNRRMSDKKEVIAAWDGLVRHMSYENQKQQARSESEAEEAAIKQAINDVIMFDETGGLGFLKEMLNEADKALTDEDIEAIVSSMTSVDKNGNPTGAYAQYMKKQPGAEGKIAPSMTDQDKKKVKKEIKERIDKARDLVETYNSAKEEIEEEAKEYFQTGDRELLNDLLYWKVMADIQKKALDFDDLLDDIDEENMSRSLKAAKKKYEEKHDPKVFSAKNINEIASLSGNNDLEKIAETVSEYEGAYNKYMYDPGAHARKQQELLKRRLDKRINEAAEGIATEMRNAISAARQNVNNSAFVQSMNSLFDKYSKAKAEKAEAFRRAVEKLKNDTNYGKDVKDYLNSRLEIFKLSRVKVKGTKAKEIQSNIVMYLKNYTTPSYINHDFIVEQIAEYVEDEKNKKGAEELAEAYNRAHVLGLIFDSIKEGTKKAKDATKPEPQQQPEQTQQPEQQQQQPEQTQQPQTQPQQQPEQTQQPEQPQQQPEQPQQPQTQPQQQPEQPQQPQTQPQQQPEQPQQPQTQPQQQPEQTQQPEQQQQQPQEDLTKLAVDKWEKSDKGIKAAVNLLDSIGKDAVTAFQNYDEQNETEEHRNQKEAVEHAVAVIESVDENANDDIWNELYNTADEAQTRYVYDTYVKERKEKRDKIEEQRRKAEEAAKKQEEEERKAEEESAKQTSYVNAVPQVRVENKKRNNPVRTRDEKGWEQASSVYSYIEEAGGYELINSGKVKVGDTIYFGITSQFGKNQVFMFVKQGNKYIPVGVCYLNTDYNNRRHSENKQIWEEAEKLDVPTGDEPAIIKSLEGSVSFVTASILDVQNSQNSLRTILENSHREANEYRIGVVKRDKEAGVVYVDYGSDKDKGRQVKLSDKANVRPGQAFVLVKGDAKQPDDEVKDLQAGLYTDPYDENFPEDEVPKEIDEMFEKIKSGKKETVEKILRTDKMKQPLYMNFGQTSDIRYAYKWSPKGILVFTLNKDHKIQNVETVAFSDFKQWAQKQKFMLQIQPGSLDNKKTLSLIQTGHLHADLYSLDPVGANIGVEIKKTEEKKTTKSAKKIGGKSGKNRKGSSKARLRKADRQIKPEERMDLDRELAWVKRVLPQLTEDERIELVNGLIEIKRKGLTAWGAFSEGMITLSDTAAAGTLYHEAFHFVFNLCLTEEQREAVLEDARNTIENGKSMSALELEEAMAEQFREYVMFRQGYKGRGEAEEHSSTLRRMGKRIKEFFEKIWKLISGKKTVVGEGIEPEEVEYVMSREELQDRFGKLGELYAKIDEGQFAEMDINKKRTEEMRERIFSTLKKFGITAKKEEELTEEEREELKRMNKSFRRAQEEEIRRMFYVLQRMMLYDTDEQLLEEAGEVIAFLMQNDPLIKNVTKKFVQGLLTDHRLHPALYYISKKGEESSLKFLRPLKYLRHWSAQPQLKEFPGRPKTAAGLKYENDRDFILQIVGKEITRELKKMYGIKVPERRTSGQEADFSKREQISRLAHSLIEGAMRKICDKSYSSRKDFMAAAFGIFLGDYSYLQPSKRVPTREDKGVARRVSLKEGNLSDDDRKKIELIKALQKKGIYIGGSASITLNGNAIFRPSNQPLHDLDFVVYGKEGEGTTTEKEIKEALESLDGIPLHATRTVERHEPLPVRNRNRVTVTFLAAPFNFDIRKDKEGRQFVYKTDNPETAIAELTNNGYEIVPITDEGKELMNLDFFYVDENRNRVWNWIIRGWRVFTHKDYGTTVFGNPSVDVQSDTGITQASDTNNSMFAKVAWRRPKDIFDYANLMFTRDEWAMMPYDELNRVSRFLRLSERLKDSLVIWTDASSAETADMIDNGGKFISWEKEIAEERDKIIKEELRRRGVRIYEKEDEDEAMYMDSDEKMGEGYRGKKKKQWEAYYKAYEEVLRDYDNETLSALYRKKYAELKQRAAREGKQILVENSDARFLHMFSDDVKMFIAKPKIEAVEGRASRDKRMEKYDETSEIKRASQDWLFYNRVLNGKKRGLTNKIFSKREVLNLKISKGVVRDAVDSLSFYERGPVETREALLNRVKELVTKLINDGYIRKEINDEQLKTVTDESIDHLNVIWRGLWKRAKAVSANQKNDSDKILATEVSAHDVVYTTGSLREMFRKTFGASDWSYLSEEEKEVFAGGKELFDILSQDVRDQMMKCKAF